ncbi:Fe2+-dependent dioxygenase [Chitinibacter bivalviorum]|uniref:Fe2+-dependent dioxygenase n=1 Tax=Chitinibacter bivalviorum TaxID=2739434 RepID=A0A7H9BIG9_9NEIS|nr:Fe2+-dependent dioxygenase [Chitinibacter bivalviorum]QLG87344.1 Fe2+-dependent dioxygenase [Chitinibacter bivalviorum]
MLLHIPQVLDQQTVAACRARLDRTEWLDGRITAGSQSAKVKNNEQLPNDDREAIAVRKVILAALEKNELFFSAALPKRIFPPLFNRYSEGMTFGNHVDNAVRRITETGEWVRSDLSATLFFSAPEEYDGGELIIEDTFGLHEVKLAAGDMILYPSSSLHRVEPITRGTRVASFMWMQSMIKDVGERGLLFDLDTSIRQIRGELGDTPTAVQLTGVYHNLLRKWGEI